MSAALELDRIVRLVGRLIPLAQWRLRGEGAYPAEHGQPFLAPVPVPA